MANAFFKRHSRRTCPSLATDEVAIAVHAAVYIPAYTPILVHYGDAYKRNYEVGEKCRELTLRECQNPCDAMPWPSWRLCPRTHSRNAAGRTAPPRRRDPPDGATKLHARSMRVRQPSLPSIPVGDPRPAPRAV